MKEQVNIILKLIIIALLTAIYNTSDISKIENAYQMGKFAQKHFWDNFAKEHNLEFYPCEKNYTENLK